MEFTPVSRPFTLSDLLNLTSNASRSESLRAKDNDRDTEEVVLSKSDVVCIIPQNEAKLSEWNTSYHSDASRSSSTKIRTVLSTALLDVQKSEQRYPVRKRLSRLRRSNTVGAGESSRHSDVTHVSFQSKMNNLNNISNEKSITTSVFSQRNISHNVFTDHDIHDNDIAQNLGPCKSSPGYLNVNRWGGGISSCNRRAGTNSDNSDRKDDHFTAANTPSGFAQCKTVECFGSEFRNKENDETNLSRRIQTKRDCSLDFVSASRGVFNGFYVDNPKMQITKLEHCETCGTSTINNKRSDILPSAQPDLVSKVIENADMLEEPKWILEAFQGKTLVHWICQQLTKGRHTWSHNLVQIVSDVCACFIKMGLLQPASVCQCAPDRTKIKSLSRQVDLGHSLEVVRPCQDLPEDSRSHLLDKSKSDISDEFDLMAIYKSTGQLATERKIGSSHRYIGLISSQLLHKPTSVEVVELQREFEDELERLTRAHELQLFMLKNQNVMKICRLINRIETLEQEVEKYRVLAGIERLTQSSIMNSLKKCELTGRMNHFRQIMRTHDYSDKSLKDKSSVNSRSLIDHEDSAIKDGIEVARNKVTKEPSDCHEFVHRCKQSKVPNDMRTRAQNSSIRFEQILTNKTKHRALDASMTENPKIKSILCKPADVYNQFSNP